MSCNSRGGKPSILKVGTEDGRLNRFPGQALISASKLPRAVILFAGAAALVLVLLGVRALRDTGGASAQSPQGAPAAPAPAANAEARTLRFHGVVEAAQSNTVAAPRLAGPGQGNLIVTFLVPTGTPVRKGDRLVEFDRQNQVKNALDRQAEFRDLEEQIKKKRAEQSSVRARDETELQLGENQFALAQIEMQKNEVLSRIDADKNALNLEEARARLAQLRATFDLKLKAREAELRVLEIQRDRALGSMRHAEKNAEKMAIRSPLDGIAVLNTIWKGGQMGEVAEGDEVRPGVPFLQVVNPSAMMVRARVNQADVSELRIGQAVTVHLDAYSQLHFPGRIESIAAIGITSGLSQKVRYFTLLVSIQGADPQLLPDLSAAVDAEIRK